MKTVDFIKGIIPDVLDHYGLPEINPHRHFKGECPMCGGKGKLRIDNKDGNGSWICVCGAGNIWKLLIETTRKDFKTLAHEIDTVFGNSFDKTQTFNPVVTENSDKMKVAMDRIYNGLELKGSNVEAYLHDRGIFNMPKKGVRASHGHMFSILTDSLGNPVYSHETRLQGDKKDNDSEVGKRLIRLIPEKSYIESPAVRMFPVASTLGIAEGIETALSCNQIYKCSTWATGNSGNLHKFKAPTGVNHLIIFADNDKNGTGLAAAFACGNSNIRANNEVEKVTIKWPATVCDFNDMLQDGSKVFEWVLTK